MFNKHPGVVTKSVLDGHKCLEKNCKFLIKNENHNYWVQLERHKIEKEIIRRKKAAEKDQRQKRERRQNAFIEVLKTDLSLLGGMNIVSVFYDSDKNVVVHFTTENKRNDINRFVDDIKKIQARYSAHRIIFKHIKDRNGQYLTTEEFNLIKKNKGYKL